MHLWDWKTGYNFQRTQAVVQPGSLDSESGVFAMKFDLSGTRLITAEADKTIKIYKEDDEAVSPHILYTNQRFCLPSLKSAWDQVYPLNNRDVREILRNLIGY